MGGGGTCLREGVVVVEFVHKKMGGGFEEP